MEVVVHTKAVADRNTKVAGVQPTQPATPAASPWFIAVRYLQHLVYARCLCIGKSDDAAHKFFLTGFEFSVKLALCSAIYVVFSVPPRDGKSDTGTNGFDQPP
jgi:hypothetical protein